MSGIFHLIESVNEMVNGFINGETTLVSADKLGLDIRAGHRLYINEDCIAVTRACDNVLQYYGGFEYVDKEFRQELGDFVIYLADDDRVTACLERYYDDEEQDGE